MKQFLNRYFQIEQRKSNVKTELIAGTTTFLAMAYIMFVHPNILAVTGMDKTALISATCVVTAAATFLVGVIARAPIAMAPGMGLNAFFAYSLVMGEGIRWETALGIVFISGFIFAVLTGLGLRRQLVEAIPSSLVSAMTVGIGLFIALIGFVNLGLIVHNDQTLIAAGPLTPTVMIGLAGFLVMLLFEIKKVSGAMIAGIFVATLLAMVFGYVQMPSSLFSAEFRLAPLSFKLDILGALKWSFMGAIFSLMFMDMFDSIGSLVGCCHQAKLTDREGRIEGLDRLLALDASATMMGAVLGTSTTTAFVESAAGIEQGGRTGLTAVVTAGWFLLGLIFIPLIAVVPAYATAPALILVGFFMVREIKSIDFGDFENGIPAFIIITMIALSYSISTGLAFGFISYVVLKGINRKWVEIKPALWVVFGLSILHFVIQ